MQALPYPYERWPKMAKRDALLLGQLSRRMMAGGETLLGSASDLLGAALTAEAHRPGWVDAAAAARRVSRWPVGLVLSPSADVDSTAVLELEPRLALAMLGRVLGGSGPYHEPGGPLSDGEQGVLAYVGARALSEASLGNLRLVTVIGTREGLVEATGQGPYAVWPVTVTLEDEVFGVRLWMSASGLGRWPLRLRARRKALTRLPLTMVAEVGWARLPGAELRTIRPGDVLVLDEWFMAVDHGPRRARVRARGAQRTVYWCTVLDDGLRLDSLERSEAASQKEGRRMTDESDATATVIDLTGDAPIEVTVELARFTVPLEELGALAPGEVLLSGRAIGERVVLRVGDRAIGSGELVDVDGEVGVRLLHLA